jgi:hypothetical protein
MTTSVARQVRSNPSTAEIDDVLIPIARVADEFGVSLNTAAELCARAGILIWVGGRRFAKGQRLPEIKKARSLLGLSGRQENRGGDRSPNHKPRSRQSHRSNQTERRHASA